MTVQLRRARACDAIELAELEHLATRTAMPWLPDLHTVAEHIVFMRETVLKHNEVWIAKTKYAMTGYVALKLHLIDHLAVHPSNWKSGIGSCLVNHAQSIQSRLELWTFQKNVAARALYEKHGFRPVEFTDGQNNEEKTPDVRYYWTK